MTDADVLEVAGLIHKKWTEVFENLIEVRDERNDRSEDWKLFHADRLARAAAEESKWSEIKDRFTREHKRVFLALYGE